MVRIKEEEEKKNMRKMSLGSMKNGGSINNYRDFPFFFFYLNNSNYFLYLVQHIASYYR